MQQTSIDFICQWMNENPWKHEVCPLAFAWEIDMDRKLQSNCKLVANDINELYSLMDESTIPFVYMHFCGKLMWIASCKIVAQSCIYFS